MHYPLVQSFRSLAGRVLFALLAICALRDAPARAAVGTEAAREIYNRVTPSLVGVKYVWESELGRRELVGAGVVVGKDGLVVTSIGLFPLFVPNQQMKDFRIIVPSETRDADELEADFGGRDERTNLAFLKAREPREWTPVHFEEAKLAIGDDVLSVGLLPEEAGYKTYLSQSSISALLRGEVPQALTDGGLGGVGSPVFDAQGRAVGLVNVPELVAPLNEQRSAMQPVMNPPRFFVPARDFLTSLADPPTGGELHLPWLGVPQNAMTGLNKDVAELLGLKDQPAIELGDILAGSPADKAGLKTGDVIVRINGEPLERGDQPSELPSILIRQVRRMKVGQEIALSIHDGKDKPPREIKVMLEERPKGPHLAERYYAEDLGFALREVVFVDTYTRKLPPDAKGVIIALIKPQSSAQSAKLQMNDMITELNGKAVESVSQFKAEYEAFRKDKPREAVVLVALREGNTQVIRVEPPQE